MQKIIDLSHKLNNHTTIYPGTINPVFENSNTIEKDGFAEKRITIPSHIGTHIDAPSHIIKGAKCLDDFLVDKFIGTATVITCIDKEGISMDYLKTYEEQIENVDFVLFYTAWDKKWHSKEYFSGFPTLTKEAAKYIASFKLKGVGFDTISVDKVENEDLPNHQIFLEKEIIIIENLTSLNKLPCSLFTFQCFPLKIENADGSPVRAVAYEN